MNRNRILFAFFLKLLDFLIQHRKVATQFLERFFHSVDQGVNLSVRFIALFRILHSLELLFALKCESFHSLSEGNLVGWLGCL